MTDRPTEDASSDDDLPEDHPFGRPPETDGSSVASRNGTETNGDSRGQGWRVPQPDEPPPPAPPPWLNPRFVLPVLALVVVAIAIRIIISDDPSQPDPGQSATVTTAVTTTAAPPTTTTTTTTQPRVFAPGGLRDFGDLIGLGEGEIDSLAGRLMPYDGMWYPTPANNPPVDHGPGLLRGAVTTVQVRDGGTTLIGDLEPGEQTVLIVVYDGDPEFGGPAGAFTQLGVGIACGESMPERAGLDGLGATGWDHLLFYSSSGWTGPGGGFASGETVVVVLPPLDECPFVAVSNFYRDMQGGSPSATDPAEYQFATVSYDPW